MQVAEHYVRLSMPDGLPSPDAVATTIRQVPIAARAAAAMAVEGRGQHAGRPAKWESRVSDVRFSAAEPDDGDLVLQFQAPLLGYAAPEIYTQPDFWQSRPDPSATAVDLLLSAVGAVQSMDRGSDRYDQYVLKRIAALRPALSNVERISLCGREVLAQPGSVDIDLETMQKVQDLQQATPRPQRVRVVGQLDMIRASTQSFSIKLEDGSDVVGVYTGAIDDLRNLFQHRITVSGELVFRPSGTPLRIDAEHIALARGEEAKLWGELPTPQSEQLRPASLRKRQGPKSGVSAIFGTWPGDEDDEFIARELAALS